MSEDEKLANPFKGCRKRPHMAHEEDRFMRHLKKSSFIELGNKGNLRNLRNSLKSKIHSNKLKAQIHMQTST